MTRYILLYFSLLIIILLSIVACKKDKCPSDCNNNGSCNLGTCLCYTGYEGKSCDSSLIGRYAGKYIGTTIFSDSTGIADTVIITADEPPELGKMECRAEGLKMDVFVPFANTINVTPLWGLDNDGYVYSSVNIIVQYPIFRVGITVSCVQVENQRITKSWTFSGYR